MLLFCYTNYCQITPDIAVNLLKAAAEYEIPTLLQMAENIYYVNNDNALPILQTTFDLKLTALKVQCKVFGFFNFS